MARPHKKLEPGSPTTRKILGQSHPYRIMKFGLYQYQVIKIREDGSEIPLGHENVYGVVASDLIDLIFHDINPGHR